MMLPLLQNLAPVAMERVLNSLPEGVLIAFFAWAILRVLPKQNSRTRFAVWFLALLVVPGVALLGGCTANPLGYSRLTSIRVPSAITLPDHLAPAIFLVLCAAAAFGLARLLLGLWHLHKIRQSCAPVAFRDLDPSLAACMTGLNSTKALATRSVTLATSDRVRVPAALGFWKPMIVLPSWALRELPPSDLVIILHHEFAHLRRWDDWSNLIQKIVRALFFFHPAVWWIESRLSAEREMACDDVVVAETGNPTGYASCLVSLLERNLAGRGWTMAQALVHRAREASLRLARILEHDRPAATKSSVPALTLIGAFAVLCVVALPYTPQIVAFEQSPAPAGAASQYSARVTPPSTMAVRLFNAALAHPAASVEQMVPSKQHLPGPGTVPSRGRAALGGRVSSPGEGTSAPEIASARRSDDFVKSSEMMILSSNANDEPNPAETAPVPAPVLVGVTYGDALPTVVYIRATPRLDPDSGTVVWRIQIWRVTVLHPLWKGAPQIPAAHST